jgi:F420-non-reducing hydrogenase iron-sulfur subunit
MNELQNRTLALFFCQNIPACGLEERKSLENRYGKGLRLFPLPCSGRLDAIHLLRALEEFADAAFVIACPEGACRHFEGNRRAVKRVERTRAILQSIGLEGERVDILIQSKERPMTLARWVDVLSPRVAAMRPSPVHDKGRSRDTMAAGAL